MTEQTSAPGEDHAGAPAAPPIEAWLREILRCPQCKSELVDGTGPGGPELQCSNQSCALAYRVDDGIPVLLVDEARSPSR